MNILKVLDILKDLDFMPGEPYRHFGRLFSDNREAPELFSQLSVEEDSHIDMINFERLQKTAIPCQRGQGGNCA